MRMDRVTLALARDPSAGCGVGCLSFKAHRGGRGAPWLLLQTVSIYHAADMSRRRKARTGSDETLFGHGLCASASRSSSRIVSRLYFKHPRNINRPGSGTFSLFSLLTRRFGEDISLITFH